MAIEVEIFGEPPVDSARCEVCDRQVARIAYLAGVGTSNGEGIGACVDCLRTALFELRCALERTDDIEPPPEWQGRNVSGFWLSGWYCGRKGDSADCPGVRSPAGKRAFLAGWTAAQPPGPAIQR